MGWEVDWNSKSALIETDVSDDFVERMSKLTLQDTLLANFLFSWFAMKLIVRNE